MNFLRIGKYPMVSQRHYPGPGESLRNGKRLARPEITHIVAKRTLGMLLYRNADVGSIQNRRVFVVSVPGLWALAYSGHRKRRIAHLGVDRRQRGHHLRRPVPLVLLVWLQLRLQRRLK